MDKKKLLRGLYAATKAVVQASLKTTAEDTPALPPKQDKPDPLKGYARRGDQVICVLPMDDSACDRRIHIGDVFTVDLCSVIRRESIDGVDERVMYTLEEIPPSHIPCLNDVSGHWYDAKYLPAHSRCSGQIAQIMLTVHSQAVLCRDEMRRLVLSYPPKARPTLCFDRAEYDAMLSEYEQLIAGFRQLIDRHIVQAAAPLLKARCVPAVTAETLIAGADAKPDDLFSDFKASVDARWLPLLRTPASLAERAALIKDRAHAIKTFSAGIEDALDNAMRERVDLHAICRIYADLLLAPQDDHPKEA